VVLGGRFDHQLAAHGEAEAADAAGVDLLATAEIYDRGLDVALAAPAERVRGSLAGPFATAVEEKDAVAVFDQHAGLLLGAATPGKHDDRCTVARGDVPALELQAVGGFESDVLMRRTEVGSGDDGLCGVRHHVGEGDRKGDDRQGEDRRHRDERALAVAHRAGLVEPAPLPEGGGAEADEPEPRRNREKAGVVVAREPHLAGVVDGLGAADDPEEPDRQSQESPAQGPQPRIPGRGAREEA
jgi:hypothetical protein